jgi:hypothetical protein
MSWAAARLPHIFDLRDRAESGLHECADSLFNLDGDSHAVRDWDLFSVWANAMLLERKRYRKEQILNALSASYQRTMGGSRWMACCCGASGSGIASLTVASNATVDKRGSSALQWHHRADSAWECDLAWHSSTTRPPRRKTPSRCFP